MAGQTGRDRQREGKEIGRWRRGACGRLFGRHKCGRSERHAGGSRSQPFCIEKLGETEVQQVRQAARAENDV